MDSFEVETKATKEYLSDIIRLPGYWPADEGCESIRPVGFCDRGHVQFGAADPCGGLRTCSLHWGQWRKDAAVQLVARLAAYRAVQGGRWDAGRRMKHVVRAPDQDQRWTVNRFWSERSAAYDVLEEVGIRGGVAVPHAYGASEAGKEAWHDALQDGLDPEYGMWRFLRGAADDWEEMKPLVEVRPHTHHLVAVEDLDGEAAAEIEERTGDVVEGIRSLKPFYTDANDALPALTKEERAEARKSDRPEFEVLQELADERAMEGYEDMARTAMYLLSHAAVQPKTGDLPMRQTVSYFGEVHPNAFDPTDALTREQWEEIQEYAAAAVGAPALEESDGEGEESGRQCSRDGCEAVVWPVSELGDKLADPDHSWFDGLHFDQQCELLGLDQWRGDKPPPGTAGDLPPGGFQRSPETPAGVETEEELISWLRRVGRARYERRDLPFLTVAMTPEGEA